MTPEAYARLCDQHARAAIRRAAEQAPTDETAALEAQRERWIDVYLDEHLLDLDPDVLLAVTRNADAWRVQRGASTATATASVRAAAAFRADVWDAIALMVETATPAEEEIVARGMLSRYSSAKVAMAMAFDHAMDHGGDSALRARWLRVRATIEQLSKAPHP